MPLTRVLTSEMSFSRLCEALKRRAVDIPHFLAWSIPSSLSRANSGKLRSYVGCHRQQRCFILGNGPSLSKMDLAPLKNEFTFGLNRIYLLFDRINFLPTYFVCINELVLNQFSDEIQALPIPKFLNWNLRSKFNANDQYTNFVRMRLSFSDGFVKDFTHPLFSGGTVTHVALQIAYAMGFSQVILIGVDHSFSDKGIPNRVETRQSETDANHFHPNYFPKGSKWQLPDLKRSEIAYALARAAYEQAGRKIIDATVGGKCPVFERADFRSLF